MKDSHYFCSLRDTVRVNLVGPLPLKSTPLNEDLGHPTVFIDGGLEHLSRYSFCHSSNFSLGDGDSKTEEPEALDIKLPQQKDISDTGFALKRLPASVKCLHLFGFIGGRLDHQFCLFSLLQNWCAKGDKHQWSMEDQILGFGKGQQKLYVSGVFSLFSFSPCRIRIEGNCRYTINEEIDLTPFSDYSLSNVGCGEIHIHHSTPILLFLNGPFEFKRKAC